MCPCHVPQHLQPVSLSLSQLRRLLPAYFKLCTVSHISAIAQTLAAAISLCLPTDAPARNIGDKSIRFAPGEPAARRICSSDRGTQRENQGWFALMLPPAQGREAGERRATHVDGCRCAELPRPPCACYAHVLEKPYRRNQGNIVAVRK